MYGLGQSTATVHECALDYRGAIGMLLWALTHARSSLTLSGETVTDYQGRLYFLIAKFSQLSYEFGIRWLSLGAHPSLKFTRCTLLFRGPST